MGRARWRPAFRRSGRRRRSSCPAWGRTGRPRKSPYAPWRLPEERCPGAGAARAELLSGACRLHRGNEGVPLCRGEHQMPELRLLEVAHIRIGLHLDARGVIPAATALPQPTTSTHSPLALEKLLFKCCQSGPGGFISSDLVPTAKFERPRLLSFSAAHASLSDLQGFLKPSNMFREDQKAHEYAASVCVFQNHETRGISNLAASTSVTPREPPVGVGAPPLGAGTAGLGSLVESGGP
ncbi:hypothetical protein FHS13_003170 [Nocardiopsis algeriensis]|uniref:Uncharacterized protein n=1 Tax=Nocardiopsis algeriensis TaxID=1478215 RepID=A0A841ISS3_9ACTN|nr:hypothetical protein [Nocardiopsis algeriensis]